MGQDVPSVRIVQGVGETLPHVPDRNILRSSREDTIQVSCCYQSQLISLIIIAYSDATIIVSPRYGMLWLEGT